MRRVRPREPHSCNLAVPAVRPLPDFVQIADPVLQLRETSSADTLPRSALREGAHERDETFDGFERHGVVQRDANATRRTMSSETDHTPLGCFRDEGLLQL